MIAHRRNEQHVVLLAVRHPDVGHIKGVALDGRIVVYDEILGSPRRRE
jgi:hypothetical protein